MPSTRKRVLIRKLDRSLLAGFVESDTLGASQSIELLSPEGQVSTIPQSEVHAVYFVASWENAHAEVERRTFAARPRMDGLWLRMRFHDNEVLEGVVPNNLLELGASGFTIVPPDPTTGLQRVYVPRSSLTDVQVLGVIGAQRRERHRAAGARDQIDLFGTNER
jgi:hypothetical protein